VKQSLNSLSLITEASEIVGSCKSSACSFGWWLMAGADLFGEKSTADWLLVAGLF
jgi:hypothetical protein